MLSLCLVEHTVKLSPPEFMRLSTCSGIVWYLDLTRRLNYVNSGSLILLHYMIL